MIKKIRNKLRERKIKHAQQREYLRSMPSAFDHGVISWTAREHITYERGITWKIVMTAIVLTMIALGIFYNAWTFSLAVLAFALVYWTNHHKHPKDVKVILSNIGIKVGNRKYSYSRIKAFWLIYNPPYTKILNIRVHGDILLDISIQLNNQNPAEVREFLIGKIPEMEGKQEPLTDVILRLFKI